MAATTFALEQLEEGTAAVHDALRKAIREGLASNATPDQKTSLASAEKVIFDLARTLDVRTTGRKAEGVQGYNTVLDDVVEAIAKINDPVKEDDDPEWPNKTAQLDASGQWWVKSARGIPNKVTPASFPNNPVARLLEFKVSKHTETTAEGVKTESLSTRPQPKNGTATRHLIQGVFPWIEGINSELKKINVWVHDNFIKESPETALLLLSKTEYLTIEVSDSIAGVTTYQAQIGNTKETRTFFHYATTRNNPDSSTLEVSKGGAYAIKIAQMEKHAEKRADLAFTMAASSHELNTSHNLKLKYNEDAPISVDKGMEKMMDRWEQQIADHESGTKKLSDTRIGFVRAQLKGTIEKELRSFEAIDVTPQITAGNNIS